MCNVCVCVCVLQITDSVRVGKQCLAEVSFNNPIDLTLTNCTLTFSGSGLLKEEYELP